MRRIIDFGLAESGRTLLLAVFVMGVSSCTAMAQVLETLYSFQGQPTDGNVPCAVTRDSARNMYGVTEAGGEWSNGTVFELNANGEEAVLHSFDWTDGSQPCAPLLVSSNGDLYGTTIYGGPNGNGTVFRMRGTDLATIYEFKGPPDGQGPFGGLVENVDRNLYGTTAGGGTGPCAGGCGTIYRIDRSGREAVVYDFDGTDGANPGATLVHDPEGNLYGTTSDGGLDNSNQLCPGGCGTVFMLSRSGKYIVLHKFTFGTSDGWGVPFGVVRDEQGNLYGTTLGGGAWNYGTVYEITSRGEEKVLYSFAGPPDGATPGQIAIADGKLYGTTDNGGDTNCWGPSGGCGIVFELSKYGNERILHTFNGVSDGASPSGPVAFDPESNMYGTTSGGPKDGCPFSQRGCGTVWELSPN